MEAYRAAAGELHGERLAGHVRLAVRRQRFAVVGDFQLRIVDRARESQYIAAGRAVARTWVVGAVAGCIAHWGLERRLEVGRRERLCGRETLGLEDIVAWGLGIELVLVFCSKVAIVVKYRSRVLLRAHFEDPIAF